MAEAQNFTSDHKDYLYVIADTYLQNNHFEQALTILDLILSLFEGDNHALLCRAYCEIQMGDAKKALLTIVSLNEETLNAAEKTALALIKGRSFHLEGAPDKAKHFTEAFLNLRAALADVKNAEHV